MVDVNSSCEDYLLIPCMHVQFLCTYSYHITVCKNVTVVRVSTYIEFCLIKLGKFSLT
jgi:hypothetical protein